MRENPIVESLERTGLPPWDDRKEPFCPICGQRCETLYRDKWNDVVGCDECVSTCDAWEYMDEI